MYLLITGMERKHKFLGYARPQYHFLTHLRAPLITSFRLGYIWLNTEFYTWLTSIDPLYGRGTGSQLQHGSTVWNAVRGCLKRTRESFPHPWLGRESDKTCIFTSYMCSSKCAAASTHLKGRDDWSYSVQPQSSFYETQRSHTPRGWSLPVFHSVLD